MRSTVIYLLKDPRTSEIRYVGKTSQPMKARLNCHMTTTRRTYCANWLNTLKQAGLSPLVEILETVPAGGDWVEAECRWIAHYRQLGAPLTNLTDGGEGMLGRPCSETTRQKLSTSLRGRKRSASSRANIAAGARSRRNTDEYKQNMSRRLTGHTCSAETRQKLADAKRGTSPTDAARQKMSDWQTGRTLPATTKAKISAALRGRKQDPNLTKIRADKRRGKKFTEEQRAHLRQVWAERKARQHA